MTTGSVEAASRLTAAAAAWRDADPDPVTRAELGQLISSEDTAALAERFEGSLAFGTAGIRAEIGAGPMRMNRLVIGRVATGIARYISTRDQDAATAGVVIGYDGRTNSAVFATDATRILSRAGISTWLLPRALPTPVLAFSVRHLHAAYGIQVTASHNPRQYNGLKVYVRDGGQLLPPVDADMAAAIDAVDPLHLPEGWAEGSFAFRPADEAADAYVTAVAARGRPGPGERRLTVVHTALHGVGDATVRAVLATAGWPLPIPVAAQQQPDPAFPTAHYPNPEEPGVLDLARATAEQAVADLVLANDPDADRVAVMVPGPGGWQTLTGDELGALLGDAVLTRLSQGDPVEDPGARPPAVATTVVSGSLLRRLAQSAGVWCVSTLTGFKWIARAGGPDAALIYGYEQALGYAVRPHLVADKDGISAALLVLQVATAQAQQGRTLLDRLDDLALAHGLHLTRQRTMRADGAAGLARLDAALGLLRRDPPRLLAGQPVTVTDLQQPAAGVVDLAGGHGEQSPGRPLPPADVLIWHSGTDARVMIRPSGTEPELKIYAEAVSPVAARAGLNAARTAAAQRVEQMLSEAAAALSAALPASGSAPDS
ncbi:MAG TPA: phospho-sugar mutase [Streptosporangiaceae bacterium]|nr:phospho-sugar mutase [Streptosporangiaceae bacterium]